MNRHDEIEWVDDVDGFKCTRCHKVLVHHYIANCEHKFCSNCQRVLGDGSEQWRCPQCRAFVKTIASSKDRQDVDFHNRVFELQGHCPNMRYGCEHVCRLKHMEEHLEHCKSTRESALPALYTGNNSPEILEQLLELKFEMKEMKQRMLEMDQKQRYGEEKMSNIQCGVEECQSDLKVLSSAGETNSKILKLEVKSDLLMDMLEKKDKNIQIEIQNIKIQMQKESEEKNKLQELIKAFETQLKDNKSDEAKNDIKVNVETEKILSEKVEKVEKEMERSRNLLDWKLNEQILQVNEKIDEDISGLKLKLAKFEDDFDGRKSSDISNSPFQQKIIQLTNFLSLRFPQMTADFNLEQKGCFLPDFTWKISGIKAKLRPKMFELKSETFTWTGYPVRAQAKIKVKTDDNVYMSLVLEDNSKGKGYDIKPIPNVYYVLRDRSRNSITKHKAVAGGYLFTSTFNYLLNFERFLSSKAMISDSVYVDDDCIMIDIYIEPPSMTNRVYSHDGSLNWAIDNYQKIKEIKKEQLMSLHESPYFYTGPKGYRVQVKMFLHELEKSKRQVLAAQISFLSGEFDEGLNKSFSHQTTITILNRKDPDNHITRRVDKNIQEKRDYIVILCSFKDLENLIENDTIFYNANIKSAE